MKYYGVYRVKVKGTDLVFFGSSINIDDWFPRLRYRLSSRDVEPLRSYCLDQLEIELVFRSASAVDCFEFEKELIMNNLGKDHCLNKKRWKIVGRPVMAENERLCTKCLNVFDVDSFYTTHPNYTWTCKTCQCAAVCVSNHKHARKKIDYVSRWRRKNPEKVKQYSKKNKENKKMLTRFS